MKTAQKIAVNAGFAGGVRAAAFGLCVTLLALVPLAFSASVYRMFSLPKFAILLILSSALAPLLALAAAHQPGELRRVFRSTHVEIVCLYSGSIALSTIFGVAPLASLFGSFYNQMGLITHICFIVCFFGLIFGIGASGARLLAALWAVALTGFLVAAHALIQFSGHDPFLSYASYSFKTESGPIIRVLGTLGHADYLGNFLLYTTPPTAAFAVTSRGRARLFAVTATALSVMAIACSGTRGAWLGAIVGLAAFAAFETRGGLRELLRTPRRLILGAMVACVAASVMIWAVSLNPMSRSIAVRARSVFTEGTTGAGRTLLWRDSIRMIPKFALTGAGPEGFRKAFLAYKSKELARLAPGINNESAHNSYIDAAISYGLAGAVLYVAVIASSLTLLLRARRHARGERMRVIITGIFSSLVAVAVHNIFIFDQIPTGLYFFAFAALAFVTAALNDPAEMNEAPKPPRPLSRFAYRRDSIIAAIGFLLTGFAIWYAASIARADWDIRKALAFAEAGDLDGLTQHGGRAASSPDPTGGYDFLFAQALATCSERMRSAAGVKEQSTVGQSRLTRMQAVHLAIAHAGKSAAHTLTPDSSYVLLAYLALLADDAQGLRAYATEAINWDQNYSDSHWLMAEAYLKEGARQQAAREAELALSLRPSSRNAASALARATSESEAYERTVAKIVTRARRLADAGDTEAARRLLFRAIRKSSGPCPECHKALALVYEMTNSCDEAVAEWQAFIRQDSARAAAEQVEARIERLKQKAKQGECGRS